MNEYTPTTEEVRRSASDYRAPITPEEFDRWLAEHDRQVAERAWDAGYFVGLDRGGYHGPDMNPYRKGQS